MSPTEPWIQVRAICKAYGTAGAPVRALDGVSFVGRRGEKVALVGKSGSGKSTLLQLLGALDRPTSGRLAVAGSDLAALRGEWWARFRQEAVGFVFQAYHLIPSRS